MSAEAAIDPGALEQGRAINFRNAIVAVLVALMGSYGVDHGLSTTVASRFTLGHPLGTRLCSILLLISLVGWYAVVNELAGLAVDGIVKNAFGFSAPALFIILVEQ